MSGQCCLPVSWPQSLSLLFSASYRSQIGSVEFVSCTTTAIIIIITMLQCWCVLSSKAAVVVVAMADGKRVPRKGREKDKEKYSRILKLVNKMLQCVCCSLLLLPLVLHGERVTVNQRMLRAPERKALQRKGILKCASGELMIECLGGSSSREH